MPRPALRSRSLRRILKKIPGGAFIIHYSRRNPSVAKCAKCKKPLKGVARKRPSKLRRLAGTFRKPSRPYGGNLCSSCMRDVVKETKLKR